MAASCGEQACGYLEGLVNRCSTGSVLAIQTMKAMWLTLLALGSKASIGNHA
jgi:hypothetical protein